jgi:hypothetical protein
MRRQLAQIGFMKTSLCSLVLVSAIVSSCAAEPRSSLALATVGPAPQFVAPSSADATGTLLVFSAYETSSLGASPFDDIRPHTAYKIYGPDGRLLQKVANRVGALGEDPTAVKLAPGLYRVVANSNTHGVVTVPVLLVEHQLTTVHLDSEASLEMNNNARTVRLPDGQAVGWSGGQP